jgi:nitrate/nitrite transport system substrate-binding protein
MKQEQFPNLATATFIKPPQTSRLDGLCLMPINQPHF